MLRTVKIIVSFFIVLTGCDDPYKKMNGRWINEGGIVVIRDSGYLHPVDLINYRDGFSKTTYVFEEYEGRLVIRSGKQVLHSIEVNQQNRTLLIYGAVMFRMKNQDPNSIDTATINVIPE